METFNVCRKEMTHKAFESGDRPLRGEKKGDFSHNEKLPTLEV